MTAKKLFKRQINPSFQCFVYTNKYFLQGNMYIWLVNPCEPLPTDGITVKTLRIGFLAEELAKRGHKIVWWSSNFDHARKQYRSKEKVTLSWQGIDIILLPACSYKKNISIARLVNHWQLGKEFVKLAPSLPPPDLIFSTIPTIELSRGATIFGMQRGIPVVLDIHDLWPDIFLDIIPKQLKWLGYLILKRYFCDIKETLEKSTSIVGVSDEYLNWGVKLAGRKAGQYDKVFPLGCRVPSVTPSELEDAKISMLGNGVNPSKIICWFIGMFGKTYDLSVVINAARYLEEIGDQRIQFIFSGNGDYYHSWSRQARGLKNVIFTGWVDIPQTAYLMSIADIGLAAYAKGAPQGHPYKIFEYLCAGVPILSSLQGETKMLLDTYQCGLTYEAGNTKSFLEVLTVLLNNESMRITMGEIGSALFKDLFSADKVYTQLVDFLERQALHIKPHR